MPARHALGASVTFWGWKVRRCSQKTRFWTRLLKVPKRPQRQRLQNHDGGRVPSFKPVMEASKKKGMWMGGMVPLGYDVKDRRLTTNPVEAELVGRITGTTSPRP
jgi:hypothetical protein